MEPLFFYSHNAKNGDKSERHVFSQWFMGDFVDDKGITYNCAEQYMMAEKARLFMDSDERNVELLKKIMKATTQSEIKNYGREVKGFDPKVWDQHKFNIVVKGNTFKFANQHMKKILLQTDDKELIEASPYDRIWGIGYNATEAAKVDRKMWGENLLGKALMVVREKLKNN